MNLEFEIRIGLSKAAPAGIALLTIDKYAIRPLPGRTEPWSEFVLSFRTDDADALSGTSHPEEEALSVARLISLFLNTRIFAGGVRINAVDVPHADGWHTYPQFLGELEAGQLGGDLERFLRLPRDLARQYLRAANSYSTALGHIPKDITFAFFLLVVAVECLSSQDLVIPHSDLDRNGKKCERFCRFLRENLPQLERTADERDEELLTELLKTVYYSHRSGFVHGGREVSSASLFADRANSSYFKHRVDGRETKTPGIGWFAGIVRRSLVEFCRTTKLANSVANKNLLTEIGDERAGLQLKAKTAITRGQVVRLDDIEFR